MRLGAWVVGLAVMSVVVPTPAPGHPLDALSPEEIVGAADVLIAAGVARPDAVFQSVSLHEPDKARVLAGLPVEREALVFFRQDRRSFRTVVNLDRGTFTAPVEIPRSHGQLGLTIGEIFDFTFLFEDPAFLAAMAARGLDTPEELAQVFVTPLTSGSFGLPEERRRIVKAQMYFVEGTGINLYARPIEGVQAIADLDARKVLQVLDSGVVPIPSATHEFDEASVEATYGLRRELRPIEISQPEGSNVSFDGSFIEWQKWRFHVRFDRRSGLILSSVTYDCRSVLYQGSLSEIFVPYQDPGQNWFYRTFMDAGEFGLGSLASPLTPGLDVPPTAALLDAVVSASIPAAGVPVVPLPLEDVVGVFERLTGYPIWRHFELFSPNGPSYEGRAEVELVVRMIAQVGNYDYLIDWIFAQDGSLRVEVGLTGIDVARGVFATSIEDPGAAEETAHGALVAPQLVATHHSHHFNFRLDLDVDGRDNSFVDGRLRTVAALEPPRKSVWVVEDEILEREGEGMLDDEESVWRVINPGRTNAWGYPTGYLLESEAGSRASGRNRGLYSRHVGWLVERSLAWGADRLTVIALWDGKPGDGSGGTADLVEEARRYTERVFVVSPG